MTGAKRAAALLLCAALTLGGTARALAEGGGDLRYVALTFDDGPTCWSGQLLDGLAQRLVPATFFLCGYQIERRPELVRRMAAEGHELAVHGQSHRYLHDLPADAVRQEVQAPLEAIEALTGVRPKLFRPPGGLCGGAVRETAAQLGLPIILWNVDPQDWENDDVEAVAAQVVNQAADGAILLMHELSETSVAAALLAVDRLQARGYQFLTVSELAYLRRAALIPGKAYRQLPPSPAGGNFAQNVV